MAAGNPTKIITGPGRIIVGPTDAFDGSTYPYGGTEVGRARAVALTALGTSFGVVSEGLGEFTDILEPNNHYVFSMFLRGWDDDAVAQFMAGGVVTGDVSQHAVFGEPGTQTPGQSSLSRGIVLVYVPDDTLTVPALVLYNFIPDWEENAAIAFGHKDPLGIPIAGECLRNTSGNIFRIGRLPDLALT